MESRPLPESDPQTFAIIGAAMEVHRLLGHGFLEAVYRDALKFEFELRNIPFRSEVELPVCFKGRLISTTYRVDAICYDQVIVELKALRNLTGIEESQTLNYLKASRLSRALILNFGAPGLQYRRLVQSRAAPMRKSNL
jgi:GxxExxY protein